MRAETIADRQRHRADGLYAPGWPTDLRNGPVACVG
jgi:hypothetical protein